MRIDIRGRHGAGLGSKCVTYWNVKFCRRGGGRAREGRVPGFGRLSLFHEALKSGVGGVSVRGDPASTAGYTYQRCDFRRRSSDVLDFVWIESKIKVHCAVLPMSCSSVPSLLVTSSDWRLSFAAQQGSPCTSFQGSLPHSKYANPTGPPSTFFLLCMEYCLSMNALSASL
ncbi:hypothetical protein LY76DRAFT_204678 [Colletotrichum caudatum]|nr:hypothetical protein LY76DRAFT_204678 [Colletotrichum caudatum]